jgi:hypothetical protein
LTSPEVTSRSLPSSFLTGADDLRDAPVPDAQRPLLAALAGEAEANVRPVDLDVAVLERGQAVAPVLLRIVVVADPDQRGLEEVHDGGEDLLARKAAQRHVLAHPGANRRQPFREDQQVLVFGALAQLAEARVIAVLLAPARIAPRRLDVAVRRGTDPHVGPGRGNGKGSDPLEHMAIAERDTFGPQVGKAPAGLLPAQPGMVVGDVAQAPRLSRILGIDDNLDVAGAVKHRGSFIPPPFLRREQRFRRAVVPGDGSRSACGAGSFEATSMAP